MSRRISAAWATAVAVILLMSGCIGGPTASPQTAGPTSAPSTPASPTAEPVDPLTTVTVIVARPDVLELRDAGGAVVASLDYLSSTADALGVLTTLFREGPADEDFDGSSHFPPSTVHRWGGFELWEQRYVDQWADSERSLARPEFAVRFVGAEALEIELASSDGRHVGDAWAALMAEPTVRTVSSGCSGPYVDFVELEDVHSHVTGETMKVSVEFDPVADESAVASISAPMPVFEDACA